MKPTWQVLAIVGFAMAAEGQASGQCEIFHATGNPSDLLGDSVGVHGDWLVYTQRQTVHVLRWTGATWSHYTELSFPSTVRAVDVYDDMIVAGVLGDLAIRVFHFDGSTWQPGATINGRWSPSPFFGRTLDLHGDLLITCYWLDVGAWIYRYNGGQWIQEFENEYRWDSVATDGATCVLGNYSSFWIYRHDGTQWVEDDSRPPEYGAEHVDVWGDILVSSQPEREFVFDGAEVFRRCDEFPDVWCSEEIYYDAPSGAVYGNAIAIANAEENRVALYYDNSGTWSGIDVFSAFSANESFGYTLEMDGASIVVGAPYDDTGGEDAGAIYVFRRGMTYVAPVTNGFELGNCLFPFDTVQEGLNAAPPGAGIVISAGTYAEAPLVLDTPVRMSAAGGHARIE